MRTGLLSAVGVVVLGVLGCDDCGQDGGKRAAPAISTSTDPEGRDLVKGAVVAAVEKSGGIRLYKIVKVNWFPDPVGEEVVMIAYEEKVATFELAAQLWAKGKMTVALPKVRVAKHMFMKRNHRVIANEPVTEEELAAERGDPQRHQRR